MASSKISELTAAGKAVALDGPGKALALAFPGHIHILAHRKNIADIYSIPLLELRIGGPEFPEIA